MTISPEQLGDPVDARPLMRTVRGRIDDLVSGLDDADWRRSTVCPGWNVADLVGHLIGDDLGRLSSIDPASIGSPWRPGEDLPTYLERINDEWVVAMRRLSPAVLVSLLGAGGAEVLDLWDEVIDVDAATGAVSWAGLEVGVGWMDHARDTTEYWIHEQQLREAVLRPSVEPDEVAAVVDILARGLPFALRDVDADDGAHVDVQATELGLTWRADRRDGRWWFAGHAPLAAGGRLPRRPRSPPSPARATRTGGAGAATRPGAGVRSPRPATRKRPGRSSTTSPSSGRPTDVVIGVGPPRRPAIS